MLSLGVDRHGPPLLTLKLAVLPSACPLDCPDSCSLSVTVQDGRVTKIGAGPIPIETSEGWLLIYHGVLTSCNGFVYSAGVALLDLEQPWKVIARGGPYIISPQTLYECVGDVPNVVFPCAALCDADTGRLAIYYGAADTVTGLAHGHISDLITFARER